jgi:hypothetical protein
MWKGPENLSADIVLVASPVTLAERCDLFVCFYQENTKEMGKFTDLDS